MKFETLKYDKGVRLRNNKNAKVQEFGDNNDYYQIVRKIVAGSVSGSSSVNVYSKFINGRGFAEGADDFVINKKRQTLDDLLRVVSEDLAMFNGFALHVNYNALGQKTSIYHVPFEHVRFEVSDEEGFFDKVAIHDDWAKEFTHIRRFKNEDIVFVDLYNPDLEVIEKQAENAGGWGCYQGQVYYYSGNRDISYPTPIYSSALTDMSSDEGLSNINYRNIRNRFMPGGILVGIRRAEETNGYFGDAEGQDDRRFSDEPDIGQELIKFQGDEEACKLGYMEVENKDDVPQLIQMQSNNYDKDYTSGETSVRDKIGRAFNQPPVLRAENVGVGFGSELMRSAYSYYNSITETERYDLTRAFTDVFRNFRGLESADFTILPKKWEE